ncbi:MAG: hypothetical protein ACYDAQ_05345 [Mycobacteriales bacterium]
MKTPGAPPVLAGGTEVRAVGQLATGWSMGEHRGGLPRGADLAGRPAGQHRRGGLASPRAGLSS